MKFFSLRENSQPTIHDFEGILFRARSDHNLNIFRTVSIMLTLIFTAFLIQDTFWPGLAAQHPFSAIYSIVYVSIIAQDLPNLLSNAVKFTGEGGWVTVSCRYDDPGMAAISVRDTGIGIPDEMLPGLFAIDVSTGRKGTSGETGSGLGLMLCAEFVEKNGGTIQVDSEVGRGSVFTVTISAARDTLNE